MQTIWKYPIQEISGYQFLSVPRGAKFLSAIEQYGKATLYAMVDPVAPVTQTKVVVRWTGAMDDEYSGTHVFLGTVKLYDGEMVLHIFVEKRMSGRER